MTNTFIISDIAVSSNPSRKDLLIIRFYFTIIDKKWQNKYKMFLYI